VTSALSEVSSQMRDLTFKTESIERKISSSETENKELKELVQSTSKELRELSNNLVKLKHILVGVEGDNGIRSQHKELIDKVADGEKRVSEIENNLTGKIGSTSRLFWVVQGELVVFIPIVIFILKTIFQ